MAWRYRRSKSFGPFRMTASNSGLGFSFGGPLGRISVNTRGQVRQTTRIPGLGLYNTQQIGTIGGSGRTPHRSSSGSQSSYSPTSPAQQTTTYPHLTTALPVARAGTLPAYELATPSSRAKAIATTIMFIILETLAIMFLIGAAGAAKSPEWVGAGLLGVLIVGLFFTIRSGRAPKPAANNIVIPPSAPITAVHQYDLLTATPTTSVTPNSDTAHAPINLPGQITVSAFDATGGIVDLDPAKPDVVSVKVVEVKTAPTQIADFVKLPVGSDGLRHGVHEGILIPTGTEWRAYGLVHSDDNPDMFHHLDIAAAISVQVGRLSIRDVRTYAPLFSGHPVQISLYIEATPGLEQFEVRFLNRPATSGDDPISTTPVSTTTPAVTSMSTTTIEPASTAEPTGQPQISQQSQALPAANWFIDPTNSQQWRWWDGTAWTTYTSPK